MRALEPLGEPWEVVFVDDGSTRRDVRCAHPAPRARRRTSGSSGCAATSARRPRSTPASREAEGDVVVTIDGDLQDDPAEIPRLLAKLDEGFDLVSGWKTHRRDPLTRRALSRIFNTVTGWLSGVRLHDMNCGLKAYRAEVVRGLRPLRRAAPLHPGARARPRLPRRRARRSTTGRASTAARRYGIERYVRGFLDLLTVSFMGRYRHRPLHLFGGLGLLLGAIGTAILVYLTVVKLTGERDRPAPAAACSACCSSSSASSSSRSGCSPS